MLEIVTYKSQGGRSLVDQFSNSYLYSGAPNYLSAAAATLLMGIVNAERRIYFDDTHFMRGVIRQLDDQGNHTPGETRTVPLADQGANLLDVGSKVCPPNIVVSYQKSVDVGRPGIQVYRNAISSDEYNLYIESGTVPARLNTSYAPGALPAAFFSTALLTAQADTSLQMILPINQRYSSGAIRPVGGIKFAGVRYRQETFDKESGAENMAEAVQQLINENATAIRKLVRQLGSATGAILEQIGSTIVSLVTEALTKYALLSIARRAAIRWPAIYAASQVLALMEGSTT